MHPEGMRGLFGARRGLTSQCDAQWPLRRGLWAGVKRIWLLLLLLLQLAAGAHAATDTGLAGDDYVAGPFPIGFEFVFYGQSHTDFYASTNGLLQFANPTSAYSNVCLDAGGPRSSIFAFWDDLRTDVSGQRNGSIKYHTLGEAPDRQLIVQWTNMYYYGSNLPMGTFQAVLYEGSGKIALNYRFLIDERARGNSATIGLTSGGTDFRRSAATSQRHPSRAIHRIHARWRRRLHGRARKGSINSGGTWEVWSDFSGRTAVDKTPPEAAVSGFRQSGASTFSLSYHTQDNLSGISLAKIAIASDPDFTAILAEKDVQAGAGSTGFDISDPPGTLYLRAEAQDAAGNAASSPVLQGIVMAAARITSPAADASVNRLPLQVQGEAFAGSEVSISLNGNLAGRTTATEQGTFSYTLAGPWPKAYTCWRGIQTQRQHQWREPHGLVYLHPAAGANAQRLIRGGAAGRRRHHHRARRAGHHRAKPRGCGPHPGQRQWHIHLNQAYGNTSAAAASQFIDFAQLPNGSHSCASTPRAPIAGKAN
ncbi:hypothetical protein FQR65_LT08004 [Abscondita terminalis]|nr:hypothetical protein FQR65_LT08004 [Abscondita terminalis]